MSISNKPDIYTRITDAIIAQLEQGVRPWHKPWAAGHIAGPVSRPLRYNGKPYSGINIIMLWATAMQRGYSAPIWMTFRQAAELGAHVRKGEKGTLVVYANKITRTETDEATGEDVAPALTATSDASASVMRATQQKSSSPSWAQRSCAPISGSGWRTARTTRPTLRPG